MSWYRAPFRRLSLQAKLLASYLVILGVGGTAVTVIGSWIVSSTIMAEARRTVRHDLAIAHTVYNQQLRMLQRTVELGTAGITVPTYLAEGDTAGLRRFLRRLLADGRLDFVTLTDANGRVLLRAAPGRPAGDDARAIPAVAAALAGRTAAATEVLTAAQLAREDPLLRERARLRLLSTPRATPPAAAEQTSGMTLLAAAPVRGRDGRTVGTLYAGHLLTRNFRVVDEVWDRLYRDEQRTAGALGTVTIFQGDVRISTNVRTREGERALGTRVSDEVRSAVLGRGRLWNGRAFVVNDWYITAYEPIRDLRGRVVGMLYVGLQEGSYTATRNRVIYSFLAIESIGFLLVLWVTYLMIKSITRPLDEIVEATRSIAAGRFDSEVRVDESAPGEIAGLARSFNLMLASLRQMRADLEEWARRLEERVRERTEELVQMQGRVAQSERLASIGMLAAGVAHEINNPLGGILALTSLSLEDLPPGDPNRENLEEVVRQTERCRNIVKHLLEFSRQSRADVAPVDVNDLLQHLLALLGRQALFFNIEVVTRLDAALPPVLADQSQLQQVFMNIVMNAVQAMEERGTLSIATRRSADSGEVEILFHDTGCGIRPDDVDHVFDPFFTTKDAGAGTGLGLSIAYGIISKHGGTIAVQSEVGRGTTFTVRLPAARAPRTEPV